MNPAKGIRHLAARFEIPAAMAGMKKTKTNTKPKRTPSASQARSTDDTAPAAAVESNGKGTRRPDVAATNLPPPPTVRHRLPPRGKKASVSAPPAEPAHPWGIPRKKNQPAPPPHSQGVSQASPPPPVLRGSFVASKPAVGAAPEVPEIPGSAELPNPARDRLFKDLQLPKAAWESASPKSPAELKRLRISFVMAVFGLCTQAVYGLVKQGAWSSQQFESEYDAFFLQLASSAGLGRGRWIPDDLWDEIKGHEVRKAYRRRLAAGATETSNPSAPAPPVEGAHAESAVLRELAQGNRKAAVQLWQDAQIQCGKSNTKVALYTKAKVDKAEYYRWERGEHKDGSQVDKAVRRISLSAP